MSRPEPREDTAEEPEAIILTESQRVLDHQIDNIKSVDERTVWTLRIGVVLLGILVSTARLLDISDMNAFGLVGVGSILSSLLVGFLTYGVSNLDVGAEPRNLDGDVPDEYDRSDIYDALLDAHDESIAFNRGTLRVNEWLLTLTQGLLIAGVSFVVAGFYGST